MRPFGRFVPERSPPRRPDEMSSVEVRERGARLAGASPLLVDGPGGDLLGATSAAPALFSLSLMCSYWRARLVPFFTPRGGISILLVNRSSVVRYP